MSTPVRFLPVNHEEEVLTSKICCGHAKNSFNAVISWRSLVHFFSTLIRGRTENGLTCLIASHAIEIPAVTYMFAELKTVGMSIMTSYCTLFMKEWKYKMKLFFLHCLMMTEILYASLHLHGFSDKFQVCKFFRSLNFNLKTLSINLIKWKILYQAHKSFMWIIVGPL